MGVSSYRPIEGRRDTVRRAKLVGLALVAVPFALFSIFAIGEAAALEPGWWAHLLQVTVVVALAASAWWRPRVGGPLLIAAGVVASGLLLAMVRDDLGQRLLTVASFFGPLIAGGVAFTFAAYRMR